MKSHKVTLKLYSRDGFAPPSARVIEVFHDWVRESALPGETLVDPVDYSHVHEGPAVLLVGHESDYALDMSEGRPGLLYVRKRANADLEDAFRKLLKATALLEADARLSPLAFNRDEVRLQVLDRLNMPNSSETFEAAREEIATVSAAALGGKVAVTAEGGDPREPFTVRIRSS